MDRRDPTTGSGGKVPLVSEVLDRLVAETGGTASHRSALFQAALHVCTDELRQAKKGAQPASLVVLVERARAMLFAPPGQPLMDAGPPSSADLASLLGSVAPAPTPPPAAPTPATGSGVSPTAYAPPEAETGQGDPFPTAGPLPPSAESEVAFPPPPPVAAAPFEELFAGFTEGRSVAGRAKGEKRRRSLRLVFAAVVIVGIGVTAYFYLPAEGIRRFARALGLTAGTARPPANAETDLGRSSGDQAQPALGQQQPEPQPSPTAAAPAATLLPSTPTRAPVAQPMRPSPAAAAPPRAGARAASQAARAAAQDRTTSMVSPDWAGRAPIYAIHFSSYRERVKAEEDAKRLAAQLGRPVHAAVVDLGGEGVWYRVLLGDFATADEAIAFRAELLARHTPDVANVYRVSAPR